MIPVKLSIRNFMSYRDNVPPLSFEGIHTACISGENGHGKSALIDAMTWALWGEARGKSDDDLIHQGQNEMGVEFDFAVGGQNYRVIRKRTRPKRPGGAGQSILDFQVATPDGFREIDGGTQHETQARINNTLHMDYQTFINSVFLRQGHADEFTKKRPGERKEVLASILQLKVYDELEERAKNLAKQHEMETAQLEMTIKEIDDELSQEPVFQDMLVKAQGELDTIGARVKEQESRLNRLRQERESLSSKQEQLQQLEKHIEETRKDIERWTELAEQHLARVKEYEELISEKAEIEQNYARFIEAKKLCEELDQKARRWGALNQRRHHLEMAIERAQRELISNHDLTIAKISELETRLQKLPQLKEELGKRETQLDQLAGQEEILRKKRLALQEAQARVNHLESGIAQLKKEIAEIEEKLRLLLTQQEARCPLCGTELGEGGIKHIETEYSAEREQITETLKANQVELVQRKEEVESLEREGSQFEKELNQARATVQSKVGAIRKEIEDAESSRKKLDEERKKIGEIENLMTRRQFTVTEQQALTGIEADLAKLGYDSQHHDEAAQNFASLEQYEKPRQRLEEADKFVVTERESANKAEEIAQQRRQSLQTDTEKRQTLLTALDALPGVISELSQTEKEYKALIEAQRQAQETLGSVKARLERCADLKTKRKEKQKQLERMGKEGKIYEDLAKAFGKGGIQAMLIETAIPEIENEANKLLSRMTDNRMQVKIETQRQTKKGDSLETLDINISDELGTRSYEMFSGGEAFRIDFALRIALSKLLARRAGAPLRTLIIDEGFGTQDTAGIEKIKEAINSIQDDFDKILVITHIEELRDAFPARIDVTKTAEGSMIQLS